MPDPEDPLTEMAAAAVGMHELFAAYTAAGFTESQALHLVSQMVIAMVRAAQ